MATTITGFVTARGFGGNYCEDLAALRGGGVRSDGAFLVGEVLTPGFRRVKEPGEVVSIMLRLSDGQLAHGDCSSVTYAGYGGRDPVFRAAQGEATVRQVIGSWLLGQDVAAFRPLAAELEQRFGQAGSNPVHTAVRYGLSQAILHAVALASHRPVAAVLAEEYGQPSTWRPVPILAQSGRDRYGAVDRMILRQVPVIPHGDFTSVGELGPDGAGLLDYVGWLRKRVAKFGEPGYRPAFHLDLYGTLGDLCGHEPQRVADYIIRLEAAAGPHALTIESPMLGENREAVNGRLSALVAALEARASSVRIAADEFCNSLSDIEAFADRRAAHLIQIKMPDLGGVDQSIEAVRACHERGLLAFLGGSCNETDWSSRLTVHIALAMEADLIYNKPGFGVDEGHMVVHNEMARTLALLKASGVATAAVNPGAATA